MVGGSQSSFDRARPVLQMMANRVTLCGGLGAGLAAKIANKYVVVSQASEGEDANLALRANSMLLGITMLGLR